MFVVFDRPWRPSQRIPTTATCRAIRPMAGSTGNHSSTMLPDSHRLNLTTTNTTTPLLTTMLLFHRFRACPCSSNTRWRIFRPSCSICFVVRRRILHLCRTPSKSAISIKEIQHHTEQLQTPKRARRQKPRPKRRKLRQLTSQFPKHAIQASNNSSNQSTHYVIRPITTSTTWL